MKRQMVRVFVCVLVLLGAIAASAEAQSVVANPTKVVFTASASHDETFLDGTAKLTSYRVLTFEASADVQTGTPVATIDVGKPTPQGGQIELTTATVPNLFAGLSQGVIYKVAIEAVGPEGATRSPESNPFGFEQRTPPAAVAAVAVQ